MPDYRQGTLHQSYSQLDSVGQSNSDGIGAWRTVPRGVRPSLAALQELQDFDTALLANTIGYIDSTPPHRFYMAGDIQSLTPQLGPTVGIAFTCEVDSSTPGNVDATERYWETLEQMSDFDLPIVWVVKAVGSRPDHECVIGDGMAKTLYSVGCRGLITDGRVRDIPGLLTTPFAAYARGTVAHHVPLRFQSMNQPVEIGGITISPGDIIHANAEGVITIPPAALSSLASTAVRMRAFEHEVHMMLRRTDLTVAEKRRRVEEIDVAYGFADCLTASLTERTRAAT